MRVEGLIDVPWEEQAVIDAFPLETAPEKTSQRLWSAAEYRPDKTRSLAGIIRLHAALLDGDCFDPGTYEAVLRYLQARGSAFMLYTSWSFGLPDKVHKDTGRKGPFDCFRCVLPFSRPVSQEEYQTIVPALFGHELPDHDPRYTNEVRGVWLDRSNGARVAARPRGWDPVSSRPAQGFFIPLPTSTIDFSDGAPVDVQAVLGRPCTGVVRARVQRAALPPTEIAAGALEDIERALAATGAWLSAPNLDGWRRSACPACAPGGVQKSPSFRVRANGDLIDAQCFAGCSRTDIMRVLGLQEDGRMKAPSELRYQLDMQLEGQAQGERVTVDEAVEELVSDIREAVEEGTPTVIKYPAGVGKSHASAVVLTEQARSGYSSVYTTQEHAVAAETQAKLPPDVQARSVHIHSPLVSVRGGPVCQRKDELQDQVFEFGVSLRGVICPKCPHKDSCLALAEANARAELVKDASVIFVSHAGIGQVIGVDAEGAPKGAEHRLIVDEMPSVFEPVHVTADQLRMLSQPTPLLRSIPLMLSMAVRTVAAAWLAKETPGEMLFGPGAKPCGNALSWLLDVGCLSLKPGAHPTKEEMPALKAAGALIRLAVHFSNGGHVWGFEDPTDDGLSAMLPDAAHRALISNNGVLLSATPMLLALPKFRLKERHVTDGAKVRRVMVLARRTSTFMTKTYTATGGGTESRDPKPGEEPGIPWETVNAALQRAYDELRRFPGGKALFVTFKPVADALRAAGPPPWLEVAHYGAVRGKNDWMEGRERECSVLYCLGTPRGDVLPTLAQLGCVGADADDAWRAHAAGELTQAEGRLRIPRRTKPCTVVVEGDVAPDTWSASMVDELIELDR